jgi:crotonobetainyl-CoA:carnitine CoA-transferase CaiB-like acyl-CoA transferase
MPNVLYRLSESPGRIRFTGRAHGADTAEILSEIAGLDRSDVARLREQGVV